MKDKSVATDTLDIKVVSEEASETASNEITSTLEPSKPLAVPLENLVKQTPRTETIPSNWGIFPTDDNTIVFCKNNVTGREFTGTRAEFLEILRS
jgi:hypothetical protein